MGKPIQKLRSLYYRVKYRIIQCLQSVQFYYEVLRHPILVKNAPMATTIIGKHYLLYSIDFAPRGIVLWFKSQPVYKPEVIDTTWLLMSGVILEQKIWPLSVEIGDTFSPTWKLEMKKLE